MALPTILVNSATGSDSLASGAGPGTALTGSSASTNLGGTVVTLDGSPDLTNVAVDGSHVIYLADTTAGARNFGKITAKDAGAFTVTVANAFGVGLTGKSWAIGGKRASIGSTTSTKLFSNNSGNGDAMPGWIVELESGHTETITAQYNLRRAGDTTDGNIVLRGASGTRPILTFSNNGNCLNVVGTNIEMRGIEVRNSNATKTASVAISLVSASVLTHISDMVVTHATDKFWKAVVVASSTSAFIENCEFANCASNGVSFTGTAASQIIDCHIHKNAGAGILISSTGRNLIERCIINANTGDGINNASTLTTNNFLGSHVRHCTIHGNGGDGIEIAGASTAVGVFNGALIENNCITGNGAYGIAFTGGSVTATLLAACRAAIRNNCFGSGGTANTSGAVSPTGIDSGSQSVDPGYTDTGTDNFTIGPALRSLGYPTAVVPGTSTRSHMTIGALQPQAGKSRVVGG